MIVTIKGILTEKKPDTIIVDCGGLGYACHISTNTYDALPDKGKETGLLTYFHVTENSQNLFAFHTQTERELFLLLIGVSGIGPKTAIVLLSSVTPEEFKRRLIAGEVSMLTALPGIGPKTARRIIVELKDKFVKLSGNDLPREDSDTPREISDAYDALTALGFQLNDVRRAVAAVHSKSPDLSTEELIKKALVEIK
ncbi:MAG: Holliday junction branch migration protein RuvA [Candidatus Marinimicrobia bacterium]|jgi:Holliday junction DNA helicase RuvA|nr:Holliday junction branch migration protein RuvA [Candidatus Neomarinimicrobiota bacterium]